MHKLLSTDSELPKPVEWMGSSLKDLRAMPDDVKDVIGYAIHVAQQGATAVGVKPLRGFGGAGVLEIIDDHDGNAYRAVYTVRFRKAIYVLHAFQKKSKHGISTPLREIELIRERFQAAERHYKANYSQEVD